MKQDDPKLKQFLTTPQGRVAIAMGWTDFYIYEDNSGPDLFCGKPPLNSPWEKAGEKTVEIPDFSCIGSAWQLIEHITNSSDFSKSETDAFIARIDGIHKMSERRAVRTIVAEALAVKREDSDV